MFARTVTMKLKPNSVSEFKRKLDKDIVPLLQGQTGFRHEITVVNAADSEALAISLWDRREDAEAYSKAKYTEVVKMLGAVVDGTPHVRTGEVSSSTLHKIDAIATEK